MKTIWKNSSALRKASNASQIGPYHVDGYLTEFAQSWFQDATNFISRTCATQIPVNNQSDLYFELLRGYLWRNNARKRPMGGTPAQIPIAGKNASYFAEEWALEHPIDDRQRANTNAPVSLDEQATRTLLEQMMIAREAHWATNFFTTGVWSNDYVGGVDFTVFDDANSTPIEVIDTYSLDIARLTGRKPNKIVAGAGVTKKLRTNPDIADKIKYVGIGVADEAKLAELFGVETYMTASAIYNVAEELAPTSGDNLQTEFIINENSLWLGYIDPNPSLNSVTAIAAFNWTGLIGGGDSESGAIIETFREDRAHSDFIQARMAWDQKQVAADLGVFLSNAITPYSAT